MGNKRFKLIIVENKEEKINIQELRTANWLEIKGDETLRVNYDLNENSIVFDVGGYKGDWANAIYEKYNCNIYIFEPVEAYAEHIKKRFESIDKIKVYAVGLSNANRKTRFSVQRDSSSAFKEEGNGEEVKLIDISEFIKENEIGKIGLLKANIEGGEYDLLGSLINSDLIKIIDNIQVQFHSFVESAEKRMLDIQSSLKKTHYLTYQFEYVWENWTKKKELRDLKESITFLDNLLEQIDADNIQQKGLRRNNVKLQKEKMETVISLEAATKELTADKNRLVDCKKELETVRNSKSYKLGNLLLRPLIYIKEIFR